MNVTFATEVKYLKGVGPQRAATLASRGILSVADLLLYLPFRYEDRIRFNQIAEIAPGGTYTIHGTVADAGIARFTRGRGAIFHLVDPRFEWDLTLQIFSRRLYARAIRRSDRKWSCTAKRISIRAAPGESK